MKTFNEYKGMSQNIQTEKFLPRDQIIQPNAENDEISINFLFGGSKMLNLKYNLSYG